MLKLFWPKGDVNIWTQFPKSILLNHLFKTILTDIMKINRLYIQRKKDFMKKYFDIIKSNPLFTGIASSDFDTMLGCLDGKTKEYKKIL